MNITFFSLFAVLFTEDAIDCFFMPSLFLHFFLSGVTPILCTLTQSISPDTLWAMMVCTLLWAKGKGYYKLAFYNPI